MKRLLFTLATCCVMCACEQKTEMNPFFTEFQTEYGAPDFTKIRLEHYEPAFLKGIEEQNAEIKAIVDNPEEPTFENTIVALDKSGGILARVSGVFFALTEADTNDSLTALNEKMAPVLSEHSDNIYLNQDLYKRVADVHQQEQAKLLGFDCYSNFVLDENMAKNSQTVMDFLNNLWGYSLENAKKEAAELQKIMDKEGKGEKLAAWDWWYYAEKLRQEKYDLNEDEIKPYFSLEDVRSGLYTVANKLYGITLTELNDVPVYEPDVKVYEVKDADGSFLGLFYADYFPRAGKRGGAWMSNFREQAGEVRPLIYNVASFTKPAGNMPSLLTLDEVETMFHEFGHALHGMLTKCNYKGVSGTSVAQDFVELPSQIMEHWAVEPEVLKLYAKHYETREVIPDELITKIQNQGTFNQGFMTTELLAAALLDMELHNLTDTDNLNVVAFEKETMDKLGLIPEIAPRYRATYFSHIIGGYAAGYYSYLWAEVLDTDAFEAFKEHGVFDKNTADSFRKNILEKGGTEDPMTLYRGFRGADPSLEPLLKNRGLK